MQTGRPTKRPRTAFGERLHAARESAGLSQKQVAEKMKITQSAYAAWERYPVALQPEQLLRLTKLLKVSADYLLNKTEQASRRGGPKGKTLQVFEEVSQLPKTRQKHIVGVVEALIAQNK